jgi:crotonobetainyl-CoA:carnitine CoA-transferase CaiB-like acyl-CoA transferase
MTGYLAAAGMMAALLRRAKEGGSYHVKLSLARSAMWLQALGFLNTESQASLPATDIYPANRTTVRSVYGKLSYLKSPLTFSGLQLPDVNAIEPYGASLPAWR